MTALWQHYNDENDVLLQYFHVNKVVYISLNKNEWENISENFSFQSTQ